MTDRFSLTEYEQTIREVLESGGQFTLYPRGTSMLPLIVQERDSVSLVRAQECRRGDIAFYKRADGSFILHRVIGAENGALVMCGDNQLTPEYGVSHAQVIGTVERITRRGRTFGVRSPAYRLYCAVWRSFFVRRVYFRLRRVFNGGKN